MFKDFLFKSTSPRWVIFIIDLGIVIFSILISYLLRFNFSIPANELELMRIALVLIIILRAISFILGRTYSNIIRFTSADDAKKIFSVAFLGSCILVLINVISYLSNTIFLFPFSIIILEFIITSFVMTSSRIYIKLVYDTYKNQNDSTTSVLIYGAGEAGIIANKTIENTTSSPFSVIGFVDDDKKKIKRKLDNKPIYNGEFLGDVLSEKKPSHLIIAAQNFSKDKLQSVIEVCLVHDVHVLNVPSPSKWINGQLSIKQLRQIRIDDLLGRKEISISTDRINTIVDGKVVLVTGGAGSIGSEIVRQLTRFNPSILVIVDQAESAVYDLEMELIANDVGVVIEPVICDVCDKARMRRIFEQVKPDIIYHAAAYKHVPLMENNPVEAVKTNVLGSKIVADLADEFSVDLFVMISTDKAVNPTNVMGATKRAAEIYIQSLNSISKTKFITTRFGNVLGSNGSVIPLFRSQIDSGGPITVTHPDITRYFMTIPEACQLVLEASANGLGGEIYIFDMGKSIKIKDLASKMIKLSGLVEGKDIQIVFTGLRPGEKLYEELLNDKENTLPTHHSQIMIAKVRPNDYQVVSNEIDVLIDGIKKEQNSFLVQRLKLLVPEYKSNNSIYESLDKKV
jgi:FlaA1/EpsC-like NDP-sugar epimerase